MNHAPADLPVLKILALTRLLASGDSGATEAVVSKDLAPLARHALDAQAWAGDLKAALAELESAGLLGRSTKGKTTKLALTDAGRQRTLEALGTTGTAATPTWAKLKSDHLPALALGRSGRSPVNLKVEILRSSFALDLGDGKPTMAQASDALASKLLGLEPGRKFTADNILRKLLADAGIAIPAGQKPGPSSLREALFRRELGDPSARKPLELLATRSVGARQSSAAEMAAAVVRAWVERSGEKSATVGPPKVEEPPKAEAAPLNLAEFARRVVAAARTSPTGWFGDAKVFISHVWQAIQVDPSIRAAGQPTFKDRLIEAHRARLLELARADLVEAMDPVDVRESATTYQNVIYHFVRVEEPVR